jgi:hypothetical protein
MKLIWSNPKNTEALDLKAIHELETINFQFIRSVRDVIEPFVKKLEQIHKNKVALNGDEKNNLKRSIQVLKIYVIKEAKLSRGLYKKTEAEIIDDINHELAIVKKIAGDAESGRLDYLLEDCEKLEANLLEMQNDLSKQEKADQESVNIIDRKVA